METAPTDSQALPTSQQPTSQALPATQLLTASPDIFWAEISPCEHLVQLYESEEAFVQPLAAYVTGGIRAGEAVIVIATVEHIASLEGHLREKGLDIDQAIERKQYIVLEAETLLARFMVNGWPDEELFHETIVPILHTARIKFPRVRAFGEMVALLWAQGFAAATVRLEYLWNNLYHPEAITLLCAYPRAGFTHSPEDSLQQIYRTHSKVLLSE